MDEDTDVEQTNRNYILATCSALGGLEEKQVAPDRFEKVYTLGDEALGKFDTTLLWQKNCA